MGNEHNATESSFKLGHNKFSDFTDYERSQLLGYILQTPNRNQSFSSQPTPTPSTGSPPVPSPQSRTRDSADHAGPSPPLELSRVPTRLPLELSSPSPSSRSSTAPTSATDTHPSDAMEETSLLPSSTSSLTRLSSSPSTSTPPRTEPALTMLTLP